MAPRSTILQGAWALNEIAGRNLRAKSFPAGPPSVVKTTGGRLARLAAALMLLVLTPPLQAAEPDECTCLWQGSFSEVAANTDLVVLGTVTTVKGNAVDLSIEQSLQGDTWKTELRVWMKARYYCRPEVEQFPVGSRWIMALNQIDAVPSDGFDPSTPNISYGRKLDYILSSCGGYYLSAQGDGVIGNLVPGMPRWEYQPEMTPVLLDLVAGYLRGDVAIESLIEASRENPAVKELMLDTKSFLRGQDIYLPDED